MKIVFVLPLISKHGAGVTEAPKGLAIKLAEHSQAEVTAVALEDGDSEESRRLWPGVACRLFKPLPFGFVQQLSRLLNELKPDVLHIHGLWVGIGVQAAKWARQNNVPYIVSPHGMMDAWALRHSYFKKKLFWTFFQKRTVLNAAFLHALNKPEENSIRALLPTATCLNFPNGVDLESINTEKKSVDPSEKKRLLFLGRLHSKKGTLELINVWRELITAGVTKDWVLEIAGSGAEEYTEALKSAAGEFLNSKILFTGHVYEGAKEDCFKRASAFILPSKSEGLPVAILEAWSYNLPVAMTDECNLQEAFQAGAAFRVHNARALLQEDLKEFLKLSEAELKNYSQNGFKLVEENYSWKSIAENFCKAYESLC